MSVDIIRWNVFNRVNYIDYVSKQQITGCLPVIVKYICDVQKTYYSARVSHVIYNYLICRQCLVRRHIQRSAFSFNGLWLQQIFWGIAYREQISTICIQHGSNGSKRLIDSVDLTCHYQHILACVIPSTLIRPFANFIMTQVVIPICICKLQIYVFCQFNTRVAPWHINCWKLTQKVQFTCALFTYVCKFYIYYILHTYVKSAHVNANTYPSKFARVLIYTLIDQTKCKSIFTLHTYSVYLSFSRHVKVKYIFALTGCCDWYWLQHLRSYGQSLWKICDCA